MPSERCKITGDIACRHGGASTIWFGRSEKCFFADVYVRLNCLLERDSSSYYSNWEECHLREWACLQRNKSTTRKVLHIL
jgi:hypothetical protein